MSPVLDVLSRVEGLLQAASKPRVYRFDIERSGGLIVNVTATEDGSSPDLAEIAPEIAKLEALMRDRPAEYLADGAARQRYAGLLEKRDKAVRG